MSVFLLEIWNVIFRHLIPIHPVRPGLQGMQDGSGNIILHCDPRENLDIVQTLQHFIGESFTPNKEDRAICVECLDPAYISYDDKPLKPKEKAVYMEGFLFPGSKAASRDIMDKHAIWQLETNDELWRYPYSSAYETPQNEDGYGWAMLACEEFPSYIGNRD